MSTKPAFEAERPAVPVEDIRSARPYLFSGRSIVALARRLASIAALIILDLAGLTLGVYVALILRALYLGQSPPLWGLIWRTEADWLPFLTVITVLVFWVGGLYRRRELRAGVGQVIASLMLVAVITLAFGLGTGYHFTTYALTPTALVLCAVFIGILRASYDVVTRDVLRAAVPFSSAKATGSLTSFARSGQRVAGSSTSSSARSHRGRARRPFRSSARSTRCRASSTSATSTS